MKYIIAVPDGATDRLSDYPNGDTPLFCAETPTMDELADRAEAGWAKTVPEGFPPGSDVALLSIFGYNPEEVYTGRAPLEAASLGVELKGKAAFRCNLVTIGDGVMKEFTAGHISTEEAREIVHDLDKAFRKEKVRFYTGVQYRHIMTAPPSFAAVECTPPHDITDQEVEPHLPYGASQKIIRSLMEKSQAVMADHPVNRQRIAAGKPPATQIWLWGQGTEPSLPPYFIRCGLSGGVISAVDLIKGIGTLAELQIVKVEGATGLPDTNYEGKADAALSVLRENDFVLIHVEGPDEMGHKGDAAMKTQCLADFDRRMLRRLVEGLRAWGEPFRLLLLPDHPTPIALKTHVNEPVPFILYDSRDASEKGTGGFSEISIQRRESRIVPGYRLLDVLREKISLSSLDA